MSPARAGRTIAALGLLWVLAAHGRAADPPAPPSVPRFVVEPSPIGLRGDVRPRQYVGVVGPLLSLRLEPRDEPFSLDVRPAWPAGARDVAIFVDGTRAEAGEGGGAVVALDGRARIVEARWTGGLAVEPPLAPLEPGQPDRGVRVLDFEATVSFPASSGGLFTTAEVWLHHGCRSLDAALDAALTLSRPHATLRRKLRPSKDLKALTSPR